MSSNIIRKIFAQDIEKALKAAREDERKQTQLDETKRREQEISRVTGELTLKIKEAESKIQSMELRLQMAEERVLATERQRQDMREQSVKQRQLTSDLVHIVRDYHTRRTEELQPFIRLEEMALGIEKSLSKLSEE